MREPTVEAPAVLAGKDAKTLAGEILAMSDDDFRAAFKGSTMERAKVKGRRRHASVMLQDAGS